MAILSIDLDDFRGLNETHGALVGDEVLRATADRIGASLRDGDVVARLGGDAFAACVEDLEDRCEAEAMARHVQAALVEPVTVGDDKQGVAVSASIGVAVARSARSAADVIRHADAALASAKAAGMGCVEVFDDDAAQEARHRRGLVTDLEAALDVGELHAAFQPEVDLATGALVGFEALARWVHPDRGPISPEEFIPIAEQSGLIGRISRVMLNEACAAVADWRLDRPDLPLFVAVNISPRQLSEPGLAGMVSTAIEAAGIEPASLCLEITESALADVDAAAAALHGLREIGVEIALDDFGTGYSSLGHLHRFPLDYLKIDRSFVGRMVGPDRDEAIVTAVIALAHALGLRTIAEGIEVLHQAERLTAMGCDIAQGYLWSRPVLVREATILVRQWVGGETPAEAGPKGRTDPAGSTLRDDAQPRDRAGNHVRPPGAVVAGGDRPR